jgi:mannose-6-phosphate isomerase
MVSGQAQVTIDGIVSSLRAGESLDIPTGTLHRIANIGSSDVVFIEVQTGTYLGEDDIERIEDDFGR